MQTNKTNETGRTCGCALSYSFLMGVGEGGCGFEGAMCRWGVQAYSYLRYALSVIFDDSSPEGGAKAYFQQLLQKDILASPLGRGGNAARH